MIATIMYLYAESSTARTLLALLFRATDRTRSSRVVIIVVHCDQSACDRDVHETTCYWHDNCQ